MQVPKKQHGGLGILGIITLLLAVIFATITVDSGRLMMEKRHLQTVADMAALEVSSQMGQCGNSVSQEELQSVADDIAAKNHFKDGSLVVRSGQIEVDARGVRQFSETDITTATAVSVDVSKTVPASLFAGQTFGQWTMLKANAVAQRQAYAGVSAGTSLLSLSSEKAAILNQLFSAILGSPVNLDLASYQGLAATSLELLDLVSARVGAGTVSDLLDSNLTVSELLTLYTDAITENEAADIAVINALNSLLAANTNNFSTQLSDVLSITTSNVEDAANATINLLDLMTTSLLVANGSHAINLPVAVSLPSGLLNINSNLMMIEPPQIAIGPPGLNSENDWHTSITTAQIRLLTNIQTTIGLNVLGLVGAKANVDLALNLEVAQGVAGLKSIQCSRYNAHNHIVTIMSDPGVADIRITKASDSSAPAAGIGISAKVLLATLPIANVDVGLNIALENPSPIDLIYTVDETNSNALPMLQRATTGTGGALTNLVQDLQLNVVLLGVINLPLLDQLLADAVLSQILSPVLAAIVPTTIDPLLSILGIETGVMDVQLFTLNVERPDIKR